MSLKNPILELEAKADGAITEGQILKPGASAGDVAPATAATDKVIGVASHSAADNASVRVQYMGRAKLIAGGTIAAGDLLVAGAAGVAVVAAPAAGVNNRIIGIAYEAAVAGDLFSAMLAQGSVQGA